jgi:outer membrane protein assembly factor BamB
MNRITPRALPAVLLMLAGCADPKPEPASQAETQSFAEPTAPDELTVSQDDWPWWRGPTRNGVAAAGQGVPLEWGPAKNVLWRADVPGRGHASPTVIGKLVVLATADEDRQTQSVVAFDRDTGKRRWMTEISRGGFPKIHPKNTHATPTVGSDGRLLFAVFHHDDRLTLAALDMQGEIAWEREVGPYVPQRYEYGYAASPLVHGSLVIVAAD